ncbi:MAG: cytochrome b N-terminal domain-containing protein, partial [Planctomycetes bacterium]|nr:cytochrome b N-terminal domain-containing protein [Planctomycetota bacterium]
TTELAYPSILALEQDLTFHGFAFGSFTRALHHFGASAFVIFVVLHMMRVYFTGAYKQPRELTWLSGIGLFLIVMGFGFTGYLLPWDQKAYFATKVGTEIASDTPLIGAQVKEIMRGGTEVAQPTLTRFYIIHVVLLPIALLGVLGAHFYLIQRHGVSAPGRPVGDEGEPGAPYFPDHTFKEALVGVLVSGALFYMSSAYRAPLEPLADPSDTSYHPRPDWYFLGLFQLLKVFTTSRQLGTFWVPAGFMTLVALLPFLDRGKERHWARRKLATALGVLVCLVVAGLTIAGFRDDPHKHDAEAAGEGAKKAAAKSLGPVIPYPLEFTDMERRGYALVRRLKCHGCHSYVSKSADGKQVTHGTQHDGAPRLDEFESDTLKAVADYVRQPEEGSEMPSFSNVTEQDRLAIAAYVLRLTRQKKAPK